MAEYTKAVSKFAEDLAISDLFSRAAVDNVGHLLQELDTIHHQRPFSLRLTSYILSILAREGENPFKQYSAEHIITDLNLRQQFVDHIYKRMEYQVGENNKAWMPIKQTVAEWFKQNEYTLTKENQKENFILLGFSLPDMSDQDMEEMFFKLFGIPCFVRRPRELVLKYGLSQGYTFEKAEKLWQQCKKALDDEYVSTQNDLFRSGFNGVEQALQKGLVAFATDYDVSGADSLIQFFMDEIEQNVDERNAVNTFLVDKLGTDDEVLMEDNTYGGVRQYILECCEKQEGGVQYARHPVRSTTVEKKSQELMSDWSKQPTWGYLFGDNNASTGKKYVEQWRKLEKRPDFTESMKSRLHLYAIADLLSFTPKQLRNVFLLEYYERTLKALQRGDLAIKCKEDKQDPLFCIQSYIESRQNRERPITTVEDLYLLYRYYKKENDCTIPKNPAWIRIDTNKILPSSKYSQQTQDDATVVQSILKNRQQFTESNRRVTRGIQETCDLYAFELAEAAWDKTENGLKRTERNSFFGQLLEAYSDIDLLLDSIKQMNFFDIRKDDNTLWTARWFWMLILFGNSSGNCTDETFRTIQHRVTQEVQRIWDEKYNGYEKRPFSDWYFDSTKTKLKNADDKKAAWEELQDKYRIAVYDTIEDYAYETLPKWDTWTFEGALSQDNLNPSLQSDFIMLGVRQFPMPQDLMTLQLQSGKGDKYLRYSFLRRLLILMHFCFYYRKEDALCTSEDYLMEIDGDLSGYGLHPLYAPNPFDFLFVVASKTDDPKRTMAAFYAAAIQERSKKK